MLFLNIKRDNTNSLLAYAEALNDLKHQHCGYDFYGYLNDSNFWYFIDTFDMDRHVHPQHVDVFCATSIDQLIYCILFANEISKESL